MLRLLFSLCCLFLSVGTVVLFHSAAIVDGCTVSEDGFGLAYSNAVVWMALSLFLCLPFLHSIAKMIYVNALPALVGMVTSFAVFYYVNETVDDCPAREDNLLLTSFGNAVLSLFLFLSELSCPKKSMASYTELES